MESPFDESILETLLQNDFSFYDDWTHGPLSYCKNSSGFIEFKLMHHDHGYLIILNNSGNNFNIGSSNNAGDIIKLRDALRLLF